MPNFVRSQLPAPRWRPVAETTNQTDGTWFVALALASPSALARRGLQRASTWLTLAETLPTRLLVPPLLDAAGAAQQLGPAATTLLLGTHRMSLQQQPQAEAQALHKPAFKLLLGLARHRTRAAARPSRRRRHTRRRSPARAA